MTRVRTEVQVLGLLALAGTLAGCGGSSGDREVVASFPLERDWHRDLDLLFVIDDSGSMAEEQVSLTSSFPRYTQVFGNLAGGLPNLHIGVVSTDVGAGPFEVANCSGDGDDGALLTEPSGGCTPPTGAYLSDVDDGAGGRIVNYSGTLTEAFACISNLGIDGCGFEQPLESMRRALDGSNPINAGFRRPGAVLAIVFVTDEDDCSAADTSLFDPAQDSLDDPLGPLSSFRCFEFGVQCDPDDPRSPGSRQDCAPRDDSPYLHRVDDYVRFLTDLVPDLDRLVIAGVVGGATPVAVTTDDDGNPALAPSCASSRGEAAPAVRLAGFVDGFRHREFVPICDQDLTDALVDVARRVAEVMEPDRRHYGRCLDQPARDTDGATAGLQADCAVVLAADGEDDASIPACDRPDAPDDSTALPCYVIRPLAACRDSGLEIATFHAVEPAPGSHLEAACRVD